MENLNKILKNLPNNPGVYQFFNDAGKIIYIGKSVNLKSRVNSYFNGKAKLNFAKQKMVDQIADIKYIITQNETESLILETNLIKEYEPKYNILMKDGKNHVYIKITDELIPRIIKTRLRNKSGTYFGPYLSTHYVNNTLKLIQKIFGYRMCNLKFEVLLPPLVPFGSAIVSNTPIRRIGISAIAENLTDSSQNRPPYKGGGGVSPLLTKERIGGGFNGDLKKTKISNIGNTKIPCIYYYIKRCSGPCLLQKENIEDYLKKIEEIKDFLNGNTAKVKQELEKEMKQKAKELKFEDAGKAKESLEAIKSLEETQIVREGVIGDFNVVNFISKFSKFYIALIEIRDSKITGFYNYEIKSKLLEDEKEILKNFIENDFVKPSTLNSFCPHPGIPSPNGRGGLQEIVPSDAELKSKKNNSLATTLKNASNYCSSPLPLGEGLGVRAEGAGGGGRITYIIPFDIDFEGLPIKKEIPKIGTKKELLEMAYRNIYEYAYKSHLDSLSTKGFTKKTMQNLLEILGYKEINKSLVFECNDISHISGNHTVASRSVIENGKTNPSKYRKFKIKTLEEQKINDFDSMREIITRRLKEIEKTNYIPDLVIIDGGKGQLSSVVGVIENFLKNEDLEESTRNLIENLQIVSIAKREEELFKKSKLCHSGLDPESFKKESFVEGKILKKRTNGLFDDPEMNSGGHLQDDTKSFEKFTLCKESQELRLIQKIRDEAHRFAITFNRDSRIKASKKNILESLPGIGEKTRKKLLKKYGNVEKLKDIPKEELKEILNKNQIQTLEDHMII